MNLLVWGVIGWMTGVSIFWAWAYWDIFLRDKE